MKLGKSLFAGVAAALVGGVALAQNNHKPPLHEVAMHEMTVTLPGGGVEHIRYSGNVAPQVFVSSNPLWASAFDRSVFGADPVFAAMDRMNAQMDRVWASFDRDMATMAAENRALLTSADTGGPIEARMLNAPPGSYSYISSFSSNGACTRSVEITSVGNGAKPKVVSQTSGDCGKAGAPSLHSAPSTTSARAGDEGYLTNAAYRN